MTRRRLPPAGDYRQLKIEILPQGRALYRISRITHTSALHFATGPDGRWNSPDLAYGILYTAESFKAAFCETFGHGGADKLGPGTPKFVAERDLRDRALYTIIPTRDLSVAAFYGDGLVRLSLDARFCGNTDYTEAQAWSKWVFDRTPPLDGILYHSRHLPNASCIALFDRCRDSGVREQCHGPVFGHGQLWNVLDELGFGLV